jgi:hypothetical protein
MDPAALAAVLQATLQVTQLVTNPKSSFFAPRCLYGAELAMMQHCKSRFGGLCMLVRFDLSKPLQHVWTLQLAQQLKQVERA